MKKKSAKKDNKSTKVGAETSSVEEKIVTPEEIDAALDELAAIPKPKRIWEVDFLRGVMILFVVCDHFMWDVSEIGSANYKTALFTWLYNLSKSYYSGTLRAVTHDVFVTLFVFASGVSCSFSRNNGKRAIKMIAFACLLTAATYAVSSIVGANLTIRFNVIHVIALSVLLWSFVEFCWAKCKKNYQKNIFGAVMTAVTLAALVVGACAKASPWQSDNAVWFFLAEHRGSAYANFCGGDYLPFLPDFGWFLVGAFLGKVVYREKKTIFPSVNAKYVCPVTFCGRYSLWVYLLSQIVMFGLIFLFHSVWNLL
ncbi:MAG: DUF1624 domain-containing protein [Firmicutes bacterium]|nr:DUF1624 domain-containing protein [Bacillota bacterium]